MKRLSLFPITVSAVITLLSASCTKQGVEQQTEAYCHQLIEAAENGDADKMGHVRQEMEEYRSQLSTEETAIFNQVLEEHASEITQAALNSTGALMQEIDKGINEE